MLRTGQYHLGHDHGNDTTAGFLVVLTDWSDGFPCKRTVVSEVEGATNYLTALERVKAVRANAGTDQYGVLDTVYTCGCETAGVHLHAVTGQPV